MQPLCRLCRADSFAFTRARSYAVYNDALHSAILLLKYEEVTRLGDWFAAKLAEVAAREAREFRADVVVPVPLHAGRWHAGWDSGAAPTCWCVPSHARRAWCFHGENIGSRYVAPTPPARGCRLTSCAFYW